MKVELEFVPPEGEERSTVRIILDPLGESPMSGLPTLTPNCKTYEELEAQVQLIERHLGKVRKEGAKFFKVPQKEG
ncbi:MAG: hypothetical protein ACYC5H_18585 [Methylovirgula sp.]